MQRKKKIKIIVGRSDLGDALLRYDRKQNAAEKAFLESKRCKKKEEELEKELKKMQQQINEQMLQNEKLEIGICGEN
jgi:chaperonin cofactor prefoldin